MAYRALALLVLASPAFAQAPFSDLDWSWMNGQNTQPPSLLTMGPVTWSLYVDGYYAFQLNQPIDHTIFPTTVAPRHDELSLNLAALGIELSGLDGPIGRLYIQYGANSETTAGQDATTRRGFFLTNRTFNHVQQAAIGWHFKQLHGINVELGIFPSYVGLESYLPQENWSYTHALVSDSTPYYFFGLRAQLYLTQHFKLELWVVNGWQTFGQWHEGRAGGYLWNWRPREWLSIVNSIYLGQDVETDPNPLRVYIDNNIQLRYLNNRGVRFAAFSLVADYGYEYRTNAPSGHIAGVALANRFQWTQRWGSTLRGDFFFDQTQAVSPKLPVGSPYMLPDQGRLIAGGVTITLDFEPSPWVLLRLEYSHRESNIPLFSGPNGITGPNGVPATDPTTFTPDLVKSDDRILFNGTLRL